MTNATESMNKEEILKAVKEAKFISGRNSMGVSESYYNPYYLIQDYFNIEDLQKLSEEELYRLVNFAEYVSNVFY